MRFKGPLADSYPSAVALVVFALTPYLVLSTALTPLTPLLAKGVGLSPQGLQLTSGMANAAYAFGTVAAVQLAMHLPGRRMLLVYATLFTVGSVLAAAAWTPGLFVAGRVLQGLCTSLMLIAAVPTLVIGWPESKMPRTGATMNLCIFGAVALGPIVGGVQADSGAWRTLFWIVAGLGGLALLFALLSYEDTEPLDRDARWDWIAQILAGGGCAAAFFGASELQTHRFVSPIVLAPLAAGVAMVVALVVYEYRTRRPLMPVRSLASTFPVAGIVVAMSAGAASVGIVEIAQTVLSMRTSPAHAAMLFWPEVGAAAATAVLFGLLFRTRFVPLLPFAGLVMLAGGAAVLTGVATGPNSLVVIGSGLVGLGVGASVSPALFMTGFSLKSEQIQRVFALVELLRGVAAFMVAPILLHVAQTVGGNPKAGTQVAMWVCFGLAAGGALIAAAVFALGGATLREPDLEPWLEGERPALESPPLAARLRR
ncbi:MAG: putative transrane efflux protein [Solirubrobacteraceae bacterium]|nr:putative transrane efflux protein [Solirubrobacteraceae bacterium]